MNEHVTYSIRPLTAADSEFIGRVAPRLYHGPTASPRDPETFQQYFTALTPADLTRDAGSEAFVATTEDVGMPLGLLVMKPDADYFTGHPRAYVEILVVAEEAEGRGIGKALMAYAEQWAQARGCREVVLDVFANNPSAIAFYERIGFVPDHIRMSKPLA
jgi:ribosomal protein S18 acetylase RimI-like enzyme